MSVNPFKKRQERTRIKIRRVNKNAYPRLSISRSNSHIYVQVIDDKKGHTLVAVSTLQKEMKIKKGWSVEAAKLVGTAVAKNSLAKGIKQVIFDKGGYKYHGRVKAIAEAAREAGLII